MGFHTLQWFLPIAVLLSVSSAHAQPTSGAVPAAPNNSASQAAPFQYISKFTQYHPFKEQPLLPWREANDTVGVIGGWRFYAREAKQPDADDKSAEPKSDPQLKQPAGSPKSTGSHSGHGSKP